MRKIVLFGLIMLCALSAFAVNLQKIFTIDCDEYQVIKDAYILTGHALPSTTGPWSAQELLNMCEEVNAADVPSYLRADFSKVKESLEEKPEYQWKGIGATFSNELNLELYAHTNNDSYKRTDRENYTEQFFVGRENWSYDLKNVTPLYRLNWETWVQDNAYAYFEFGLFNSYHANEELGSTKLASNIFLFQNFKFDGGLMDANFPYRAFVSFGGEHWSAQIGRDRLSWGAGTTGNVTISDDLPYHNMGRFTAFSDKYKYTFLTSFFPNKKMYYNSWYDYSDNNDTYTGSPEYYFSGMRNHYTVEKLDGILMYMAHRVEGRFLDDKLNLALTEAIMYNSESNHIDLALLNPVFIYHNNYIGENSNSTLSLEADYTIFNGFNTYGQFIVDEFAIPILEKSANAENRERPNAYGFLAGITYETGVLDGILKANAEFAYIDPYTYLRSGDDGTADKTSYDTHYKYGLDYVVSVRQWSSSVSSCGLTYDESILGYQYGPDCIVANLAANWRKSKLDLSFNFFQMWHGTHDKWTVYNPYVGGNGEEEFKATAVTCTTEHDTSNYRYSDASNRDAVMSISDIGLGASYQLRDDLEVYGQADLVFASNIYNIKGQNDTDFQVVLGASYSF